MNDAYQQAQAQRRAVPKEHRLKTWPAYFGAVLAGVKRFEVRKADRDFMLGDVLVLHEWDPDAEQYTGCMCMMEITYVLQGGQFGVEQGYVVLGIQPIGR